MIVSIARIVAIGLIFVIACAGWVILGCTTDWRSRSSAERLGEQVAGLWGAALIQRAPSFTTTLPGTETNLSVAPAANDIKVALGLDYRRKGLIWYPTYTCAFDATYTLANDSDVARKINLHFSFPAPANTYDDFVFTLDGEHLDTPFTTVEGIREIVELPPGASRELRIAYQTRGLGEWRYRTDPTLGRVKGLKLAVTTDFLEVDYPEDTLSPKSVAPAGSGLLLTWDTPDRLTHADLGVIVPEKLNPGPVTSRITFFAPVCLLFFFVLVMTINIVCKLRIHPMHYLFVAAGFFAFHLLLAYLVDILSMHLSFAVAAIVSVLLVTLYLRAALGRAFPVKVAVAGQLGFLVLFSYSFFFKGMTGLTVAIGSVVTLAALMWVTAHTDWEAVFGASKVSRPAVDNGPAAGQLE